MNKYIYIIKGNHVSNPIGSVVNELSKIMGDRFASLEYKYHEHPGPYNSSLFEDADGYAVLVDKNNIDMSHNTLILSKGVASQLQELIEKGYTSVLGIASSPNNTYFYFTVVLTDCMVEVDTSDWISYKEIAVKPKPLDSRAVRAFFADIIPIAKKTIKSRINKLLLIAK